MKQYKTNGYKGADGNKSGVIFVVFNDEERKTFAKVQKQLVDIFNMRKNNGILESWNEYDREALFEILVWPMHYSDSDKGKMADLTHSQISKVQKMLNKLFDDEMDIVSLFNLGFDPGADEETFMNDVEMRREMDRRRNLKARGDHDEAATTLTALFDWASV